MYFDFHELNILLQNAHRPSKTALLEILSIMGSNTTDPLLLDSLCSLKEKIESLSEEQFTRLYGRIQSQTITTTQPFYVP